MSKVFPAVVRHFWLAHRHNDVSLPRMNPRMRAVTAAAITGDDALREKAARLLGRDGQGDARG